MLRRSVTLAVQCNARIGCNVTHVITQQRNMGLFDNVNDILNQVGGTEKVKALMSKEYTGEAEGGLFSCVLKGDDSISSVKVDPALLKLGNASVERAIKEGVNDALKKVGSSFFFFYYVFLLFSYFLFNRNKWQCLVTFLLHKIIHLQNKYWFNFIILLYYFIIFLLNEFQFGSLIIKNKGDLDKNSYNFTIML